MVIALFLNEKSGFSFRPIQVCRLMSSLTDTCRELTWGQLAAWSSQAAVGAGHRIQQSGAVHSLMRTGEGLGLLAWVELEEPFAVLIEMENNELFSRCTCNPMVAPCEHAVAVIIEYIVHLKRNIDIPATGSGDPRYYLI